MAASSPHTPCTAGTIMTPMEHGESIGEPHTASQVEKLIPLARKVDGSAPAAVSPLPPLGDPLLMNAETPREAFLDIAIFIFLFLAFALTGEKIIGLIYRDFFC